MRSVLTPAPQAQRLVTAGYAKHHRRIYMLRLEDDSLREVSAVRDEDKIKLIARRTAGWRHHGVLPLKVFRTLITDWLTAGIVAGQVEQAADAESTTPTSDSFKVDIGLTFCGLEALRVHDQLLDILRLLAPAFSQGAFQRAAANLGDTGPSDSNHWQSAYRDRATDVALFVHAADGAQEQQFASFERTVTAVLTSSIALQTSAPVVPTPPTPSTTLLMGRWIEQSALLDGNWRKVHFGYTDGISNPKFVEPYNKKQCTDIHTQAQGELLLGYDRNDGSNAWRIPAARAQHSGQIAPHPTPERAAYGAFFKNGSFGALRKIQQDVHAFDTYLQKQGEFWGYNWEHGDAVAWLKAKILGRWPDGTPVSLYDDAPGRSRPDAPTMQARRAVAPPNAAGTTQKLTNDFVYKNDRQGLGCPIGAHVRRMNPRDDPVVPFLRRPLLRRGVPYGAAGTEDVGLLGLFFCTSLEEQFEHLLGKWANDAPMGMPQSDSGKDPLIGQHEVLGATFDIPLPTGAVRLKNLPAFVKTMGTCYVFFPSLEALSTLAGGRAGSYTRLVERPGS